MGYVQAMRGHLRCVGHPLNGTLEAGDARIAYEIAGAGLPLVLLHAGIADRRMWNPQMEEFSRHFQVVRYDLRGVGSSTMPAGPFSHHNDLKEILQTLGIERTHIIGLSLGASVAIDFALSYPEMVNRLIVSSVLGPPPRSQSLIDGWTAAEEAFERGGLPAVNEIEMQMWVDGPTRTPGQVDPDVRRLVAEMNIDVLRREEESSGVPQALDPPAWDRLYEIAAPTLVITGDVDQPDVLEYTARLAREIPDARLETIAGAAHMVNMEAPERFNALVVNFLTG